MQMYVFLSANMFLAQQQCMQGMTYNILGYINCTHAEYKKHTQQMHFTQIGYAIKLNAEVKMQF